MSAGHTEISVRGKVVCVPSSLIDDRNIIVTGRWLKIASAQDEDLIEGDTLVNPQFFISQLKESGLKADIFTFAQRIGEATPRYSYSLEWDNFAVIPVTTFGDWWENRVEPSVRRAVRKATKLGLVVKHVEFTDEFVRGIVGINNETPVRQGRAFWHFQKSFEDVKRENSTYPGRNVFFGAYFDGELVGFLRLIYIGRIASIIQVLGKLKHYDKRPMNALIAKAMEYCEQAGSTHLMYCNYVYNDPNSTLTEFKRRNGFEKVLVPRYYIPLTLKGKLALSLRLHRSLAQNLPKPLVSKLLKIRNSWYERKLKAIGESAAE